MDFLRSDFFLVFLLVLLIVSLVINALNLLSNNKIQKILKSLKIGPKDETLMQILEEYLLRLNEIDAKSSDIEGINKRLAARLDKKVGRVGFLRFNPYGDTGGDQSFSTVFLDDQDNGVLITTLFRRGQTQTFAKKIVAGKSESTLSAEEQQVINEARLQ